MAFQKGDLFFMNITNPILLGFQPDASILRVGDDYYIATSTFEWFPGVVIHHSRDLVHWRPLTRPLDRLSQLDLLGAPSSGGIWAPALSYDNGTFYLCVTDVKARRGVYKDLHNYLVTAPSITSPWSDPIYLNSSGFDHFLFHDTDGRKWLFNMQWDFRKEKSRFAGILMQEYSEAERRLVGPILTTAGHPDHPLQKAGHGYLVETQHGEWYMVHICSRQLPDGSGLSPLGRETAIQKVVWTEDGWLRLASGGRLPELEVPAPDLPPHPFAAIEVTGRIAWRQHRNSEEKLR